MAVHVSATFKKDERDSNGLEAIRDELVTSPLVRHVVVAVIETVAITTDVKDGMVRTPRVRFVNIEAMDGDHAVIARKLMEEVYAARTGQEAPAPTLFDHDDPELQIAPVVHVGVDDDPEVVEAVVVDNDDDVDPDNDAPWDEGPPPPSFSDPEVAGPVTEVGKTHRKPRPRS